MTLLEDGERLRRVPLSRSQQNIYNGVLQDADPDLYLIGRRYRLHPVDASVFMAALQTTIWSNPVQLCTLEGAEAGTNYPELVARLQAADIVDIGLDDGLGADYGARKLSSTWNSGVTGVPLVRYTVRTDRNDQVCGFDVHCHHILLDGGATGIIERDLGIQLAAATNSAESAPIAVGLAGIVAAHEREECRITDSFQRLAEGARRELADTSQQSSPGSGIEASTGAAARGILCESVSISGGAYAEIVALSEERNVPLNVLVAAAALAVDCGTRKSTESLLVHAVDNRFGDPVLDVATCLVNSVAQPVRFAPFASVEDVVRALDRGYVKAMRRRWLREEQYRRMYMAINRTTHVEALTLNFLPSPCALELRKFLSEVPVTTHIGPIESTTVAGVLDEEEQVLQIAIWKPNDLGEQGSLSGFAERIMAALKAFTVMWRQPLAMTVDEWLRVTEDGSCEPERRITSPQPRPSEAWFVDSAGGILPVRESRPYVDAWMAWLARADVKVGQVVVCTDDNSDKAIDLLLACHLSGCSYSVCDLPEQLATRAARISEKAGVTVRVVETAAVELVVDVDDLRESIDRRVEAVAHDPELAGRPAYIMPTSGSTGEPKLVEVSHGALAAFCHAASRAYGWVPQDTILQCAPLTSDISVEEIFAGLLSGATLVRSSAMKSGDLHGLTRDLVAQRPTLLDLPTAVWHLLCEDSEALETIGHSALRQIVVGGEAIRSGAVDKWVNAVGSQQIDLVSSYGPTETTVVVTYLPIVSDGAVAEQAMRPRLGRPIATHSVFVAFGEVVIVGDVVSPGYLGIDSPSFGTVLGSDGVERAAFATADRVAIDSNSFPVFCGRKDAQVKVAGKRVDVAEVTRRTVDDPDVCDAAVGLHNGSLGVWFESRLSRTGTEDTATTARVRSILVDFGVGSFFVVGVLQVPRKTNGKVDSDNLPEPPRFDGVVSSAANPDELAAGVAEIWSRKLHRSIRTDSSLLDEGIGSLDLVSILPETRRYLGWQLSIFDLISADTATNLVQVLPSDIVGVEGVADDEIDRDLKNLGQPPSVSSMDFRPPSSEQDDAGAIVVLGASGIVGTGFAEAVLELRRSGTRCPEVILAMRSITPEGHPWNALRATDGVRIERLAPDLGSAGLDDILRRTGAGTVVNCIGSANMLVPYHQLRPANVEFVSAIVDACVRLNTRLVHLSTSVVGADVTAASVTDPRLAPYPYAASKALAEIAVTYSPAALDFTMVRLPRILGVPDQLRDSTDILVSLVEACVAIQARPRLVVTEEVTTSRSAAEAILGGLPGLGGTIQLGRGITVLRGEAVDYAEFFGCFVDEEIDIAQWKRRLDESDWARSNPRRWAIIDAWITLGMKLDGRSYPEYLAALPAIDLRVNSVETVVAIPDSLSRLLKQGLPRLI